MEGRRKRGYKVKFLIFLCTPTLGNYTVIYQYIVSLYWSTATTVTVGYGDIHAHSDTEVSFISTICH